MQSIARRYRSHPHKMPFSIYADSFRNGDGQFEFPDPLTKLGFLAEFSKTASTMNQLSDLTISLYLDIVQFPLAGRFDLLSFLQTSLEKQV